MPLLVYFIATWFIFGAIYLVGSSISKSPEYDTPKRWDIIEKWDKIMVRSFWFLVITGWSALILSQYLSLYVSDKYEWEEYRRDTIVTIRPDEDISGSFGLFSGQINEINYYIYYKDNGNGSYSQEQVPVHKTYIIEDGGEYVSFMRKCKVKTGSIWNLADYISCNTESSPSHSYVDIHVPEGTIIRSYKL